MKHVYEAKGIVVRELDSLTITFKNCETIWVKPKNSLTTTVFHRWYAPKGQYTKEWKPFRRKLFRNKRLDIETCLRLAQKHNIQSVGTTRAVKLDGDVIVRKESK